MSLSFARNALVIHIDFRLYLQKGCVCSFFSTFSPLLPLRFFISRTFYLLWFYSASTCIALFIYVHGRSLSKHRTKGRESVGCWIHRTWAPNRRRQPAWILATASFKLKIIFSQSTMAILVMSPLIEDIHAHVTFCSHFLKFLFTRSTFTFIHFAKWKLNIATITQKLFEPKCVGRRVIWRHTNCV